MGKETTRGCEIRAVVGVHGRWDPHKSVCWRPEASRGPSRETHTICSPCGPTFGPTSNAVATGDDMLGW
jgi:hypothetical protein